MDKTQCLISFILASAVFVIVKSGQDPMDDSVCTYASLCENNVTIGNCQGGLFLGPCRTITFNVPCIKTTACTNFPQEWSACTRSCGGGTRARYGRCCSSECTRVTFDTEECNSSPCPTDPPTEAPTMAPTAPPAPPVAAGRK